MTNIKKIQSAVILVCIAVLMHSCNGSSDKTPTNKPAVVEKLSPEMEKLLSHFKENNSFPVNIDSAYMTTVKKGDSLGSKDVMMFVKQWFKDDSLGFVFDDAIKTFYTIDSVKAKGAYSEWHKKLDIGMTRASNIYALQKIKLNDSTTLLLWALCYSNQEADPIFDVTEVLFTIMNNGNIGESFLLGEVAIGADPPNSGHTITTGKLSKDGSFELNEASYSENLDDMKGEIDRSHFEYAITNGKLHFKLKKVSPTVGIKVKA